MKEANAITLVESCGCVCVYVCEEWEKGRYGGDLGGTERFLCIIVRERERERERERDARGFWDRTRKNKKAAGNWQSQNFAYITLPPFIPQARKYSPFFLY